MSSFGRKALYVGRLLAYWMSVSVWWVWWRLGLRSLFLAVLPFVALAISDRAIRRDYRERLSRNAERERDLRAALTPLLKIQKYDHLWNMVSAVSDREWDRRQTLEDKGRHFLDRVSIEVAITGTILAIFGFTVAQLPQWIRSDFWFINASLTLVAALYYISAYWLATFSLRVGVVHVVQPRELATMLAGQGKTLETDNLAQILSSAELNALVNDRKAQFVTAADECKRNTVITLAVLVALIVGEWTVKELHLRTYCPSGACVISGPLFSESGE